jgi:hypothetical protein
MLFLQSNVYNICNSPSVYSVPLRPDKEGDWFSCLRVPTRRSALLHTFLNTTNFASWNKFKTISFSSVMPWSVVEAYRRFRNNCVCCLLLAIFLFILFFDRQDGNIFFRNVEELLPDDTTPHSGSHRCVVWLKYTDVSEERTVSKFRVYIKLCLLLFLLTFDPEDRGTIYYETWRNSIRRRGVTSQKMLFFKVISL